ncbi:MAG: epoxide hydrolase family protein [bacterium]
MHPPIQTPSLQPFGIDFSEAAVADLHRRIDRFRWPEMPFDTGWSAGTDGEVLRELVDHWRNDYDWFAVQDRLNELTHLKGPVEGEGLHCVVYRNGGGIDDAGDDTGRIGGAVGAGGGAGAADAGGSFPLLLLHGWPGSFHEFHEAAPRLAAGIGGTQGFDVVVPSLPGFVLSDPPTERGMDPTRIAERLHALMGELGYGRYGVQGGDWGGIIGTQMARLFPDALVGLHLNFVASAPPPPEGVEPSPEEVAYREARARFSDAETGYSAIQGTKPRTLAYAQQDSPVGWLAWMLEKYWAWSDHGEDLWDTFSRDDVLTTAMLYWMPGRILSAARIYYETFNPVSDRRVGGRVEVPTGYARFPAEPWAPPVEVVERTYNVVRYTEPDRGGHFPALEQPEIWSEDVGRFFSEVRG